MLVIPRPLATRVPHRGRLASSPALFPPWRARPRSQHPATLRDTSSPASRIVSSGTGSGMQMGPSIALDGVCDPDRGEAVQGEPQGNHAGAQRSGSSARGSRAAWCSRARARASRVHAVPGHPQGEEAQEAEDPPPPGRPCGRSGSSTRRVARTVTTETQRAGRRVRARPCTATPPTTTSTTLSPATSTTLHPGRPRARPR